MENQRTTQQMLMTTTPAILEPSLPLQIILYLNGWYTSLWFITNFILFIWKRGNFFYETSSFRWEFIMIFFLTIIDMIRLEVATKGNKLGEWKIILTSLCLSPPMIVGNVFFLRLQSYVLKIDVIINAIGLVFLSSETLLQIATLTGFYLHYRIVGTSSNGIMLFGRSK